MSDDKLFVAGDLRPGYEIGPNEGEFVFRNTTREKIPAAIGVAADADGDLFLAQGLDDVDYAHTSVVYCGNSGVFEKDADDNLTLEYVNIGGDGREVVEGANPGIYYYIKDHLGSTRAVISEDASGNVDVAEMTMYHAYGSMVSVVEPGGDGTREKFTGKEFDEEGAVDSVTQGIQAYHFPVRMYDPEIGLWMRPDPARQFFNSYAYAGNGYNPVRFIDPIGLELRLYFTPANKLGGYHVFVWSTELQQGRGRNGSSGWTIDQGYEQKDIDDPGSNGGKYIVIEDLNGMTEEEAFDKINRYPGWNEGGFMFFLDDCHNQMEEAFEYAGLHYPTESEGNPGRFESANKNWEAVAGVFVNLIFRPLFGPWGILLGNGRIYDAESYVVLDATYRNSGNGNVRTNQAPGVRIKNRETEDEFNPTGQKY